MGILGKTLLAVFRRKRLESRVARVARVARVKFAPKKFPKRAHSPKKPLDLGD